MPYRSTSKLTLEHEDDATKCVDRMRPRLQKLIDEGCGADPLMWAINMSFAELARDRGGDDGPIMKLLALFLEFNRARRDQAQVCHRQIKCLNADLNKEGFSHDAIMWSLIGAVGNLSRGLGMPASEIEKCVGDMIRRLNASRSSSMN